MGHHKLTKYEAEKLITPVADDEATAEERHAFFAFIEEDAEIRRKYRSIKSIKKLMRTRCPCSNAPPSLHQTVKRLVQENRSGNSLF
ncbi:MAG TPA: hypothetical protein VK074_05990 [Fodinibius sp.]|nr:hypothetical protein [Fodinibius sp.]